jgi:glycosyltransferase involved in cell wall biosynthesis
MKITIICDVLGEENNGTTIAAMNLIRYLQSKEHEVKILCPDQYRNGVENYYIVPNMSFGKMLNTYVKKIGVTIAKADKKTVLEAIEGADIIHVMLPFSLGMTAVKLANERNIPVTAGFHMMAQVLTTYIKLNKIKPLNHEVYKYIYKHFYSKVDAIHYPTQFIKDVFEKEVKNKTNGYVISNGVNAYIKKIEIEKPNELKDKFVITTIGRFSKEKGQDVLIKAIKYSKHKDKIQIILAGQGVREKYYKKLAKKLQIAPIFKFFSREEILQVLNYSDMYVHCCDVELEGIACLEAITCGKLTIVSDSKLSATRSFAPDNKCMFKNRNYKDLAKVIDYFIDNPEERRKYEQLYLNKSSDFNQLECMEKMETMMYETINRKRKTKE